METIKPDLLYCGNFEKYKKSHGSQIGYYSLSKLTARDDDGKPLFENTPIYGAKVHLLYGHVSLEYEEGEPPSPREGRALDLHRAIAAHIRTTAKNGGDMTYFLSDDGKVTVRDPSAWLPRSVELAKRALADDPARPYEKVDLSPFANPMP